MTYIRNCYSHKHYTYLIIFLHSPLSWTKLHHSPVSSTEVYPTPTMWPSFPPTLPTFYQGSEVNSVQHGAQAGNGMVAFKVPASHQLPVAV